MFVYNRIKQKVYKPKQDGGDGGEQKYQDHQVVFEEPDPAQSGRIAGAALFEDEFCPQSEYPDTVLFGGLKGKVHFYSSGFYQIFL